MGAKEDFRRRNAERDRREQEKRAQQGFGKKTFRNPARMVRFTWWVAAFTFCLAIVGAIQAVAFISSERASLIVGSAYFPADALTIGLPRVPIIIELHNGGKSTATIETLLAVIADGLPPKPEYKGGTKFAIAPLLPDGSDKRVLYFETGWPKPIIDRIKSGDYSIYIFGFVQYNDEFKWALPFGGQSTTGFCFHFRPIGGVEPNVFETCHEDAYTYIR